jgi:tetratricopeptide (TPR) repeat protein
MRVLSSRPTGGEGPGLRVGGPAPRRPSALQHIASRPLQRLCRRGALLQAFSACQAENHIGLVVVDDIQWADGASLSALAFAARRLRGDPLKMVTAAREAPTEADGLTRLARDPTGTEVHLQGLSVEETGELVLALKGVRLDPVQLQHLHDATNGNPLWIRSAVHDIPAEDLRERLSLLPVAPSLALSVKRQLDRYPINAVSFAQALAILDGPQPVSRVASLAGVSDPWATLDAAIASRLVVSIGTPPDLRVAFTYPAIASTVVDSLTFGQRVSLHRSALRSSTSTAESLRHELACAPGPDVDLASRVLDYGRQRAAAGHYLDASRWIEDAAALTDNLPDRSQLLLKTAHAALAGGFQYQARRTLVDAETLDGGYRDFLLASIAWLRGDVAEASTLARSASESDDPQAYAGGALVMSQLALIGDRPEEAAVWVTAGPRGRRGLVAPAGPRLDGGDLIIPGRPSESLDLLGPSSGGPDPSRIAEEGVRGLALIRLDRTEEARVVLTSAIAAARRFNPYSLASVLLANLGMLEIRCGRWPEATLALEQALAHAEAFEKNWALG